MSRAVRIKGAEIPATYFQNEIKIFLISERSVSVLFTFIQGLQASDLTISYLLTTFDNISRKDNCPQCCARNAS